MTCASEGTVDLYVEPFLPQPALLAAGDSPVVTTLEAIAPPLGFRFVRLEGGAVPDPEAVSNSRDTWMIVATFGEFDEEAIEAGLELKLPYIGLVASKRRAGSVLSGLRARGYGEEALKVVRSPAGLPIGESGREGIPLSIMAEIFSLRTQRSPGTATRLEEATDPVCGMAIAPSTALHASEYGGETYYFCREACKREFDREPGKYATGVSA
jgi:xanthine dehydrogenase accessory factor